MRPTCAAFRPFLAAIAFVSFVIAIAWPQDARRSTWRLETVGGILFAASYLYYGRDFGSIESALWLAAIDQVQTVGVLQVGSVDPFLSDVSQRKVPAAGVLPTTLDGSGLGYPFFATAALFLFGPKSMSFVWGFVIFLGASVSVFLLRFRDDRALAVPVLFTALTLMLSTPLATTQHYLNVVPIGGYRFFVVAGILPAMHLFFELSDSREDESWARHVPLASLQLIFLLYVVSVRLSASYLLGVVALAAVWALFGRRGRPSARKVVAAKVATLVLVGLLAVAGERALLPQVYKEIGLISDPPWHRAFMGLAVHPGFPFHGMAEKFNCKPEIPAGLSSGVTDSNGHCAYVSAVKQGAEPGATYGRQYERLVRRAFIRTAMDHPMELLETYLVYKPLWIWRTVSIGARPAIPSLHVGVALAIQLVCLLLMLWVCAKPGDDRLARVGGAFLVLAVLSVAPQLVAWSTVPTAPDLICYALVGLVLALLAAAVPIRRIIG